MNIVVVDDEQGALEDFIYQLYEIKELSADVRTFSRGKDALAYLEDHHADVAFLDICMPDMDGMVLAKRIKQYCNDCAVIFLTGYADYAIEAFKIKAYGYLMKPVIVDDIRHELNSLLQSQATRPREKKHFHIQCFGHFGLFVDEKAVYFRSEKAKELLAYLVDRRGVFVSMSDLANVLWEEREDSPALRSQLRNVIAYMQRTLVENGAESIIIKHRNVLAVNKTVFTCDYYDYLDSGDLQDKNCLDSYMENYSWAEITMATLLNGKNKP